MAEKKRTMESLLRGSKYCIKCGSAIPKDDIGHRCEIFECPKPNEKKK